MKNLTPREFCFWLRGLLDANDEVKALSAEQVALVLQRVELANRQAIGRGHSSQFCLWIQGLLQGVGNNPLHSATYANIEVKLAEVFEKEINSRIGPPPRPHGPARC